MYTRPGRATIATPGPRTNRHAPRAALPHFDANDRAATGGSRPCSCWGSSAAEDIPHRRSSPTRPRRGRSSRRPCRPGRRDVLLGCSTRVHPAFRSSTRSASRTRSSKASRSSPRRLPRVPGPSASASTLPGPTSDPWSDILVVGIDPVLVFRQEDYELLAHFEHKMDPEPGNPARRPPRMPR